MNLGHINERKLAIAFSSIPGSGKTTISKILETHFKAIRFNSDHVRDIIRDLHKGISINDIRDIKDQYFYWFIENIIEQGENKFIILDFSMDRKYRELNAYLENSLYEMFVIGLYTPLDVLKERIKKRNKEGYIEYFNNLERWTKENQEFKRNFEIDMAFNTEKKSAEDIANEIIELIEKGK